MRLVTARLTLSDWTSSDIPDLTTGLNDLRASRWLESGPHPTTNADAERWLEHCSRLSERGPDREQYEFAIDSTATHKVIGGVSLTRISRAHGTAGGGIWMNMRYHGLGCRSEAFAEKIRFAFEDLNLRRLENGFFKGNEGLLAMQKRFGYRFGGERRQAYLCMADRMLEDECITGLLRAEWPRG